jgi:Rrf2 family iron-sulfur cluster assembly transcriptional regulator
MLSTTAQHALRAMAALASSPDKALLGREISELADIPPNYLAKILLDLNRANLVTAVRGTGGGYRLQRPADEITLIEIIDIFDQMRARPSCMLWGTERICSDETACTAHAEWKGVRDTYLTFFRDTTLDDLALDQPTPKRATRKSAKKPAKRTR